MRRADDFTSMGTLLKSGFFAIPAYQRDYAWTPADCISLSQDIFRIAQSQEKHFLGSIVVMKIDSTFKAESAQGDPDQINSTSTYDCYHVVDGQQRLTSCSLFLCALAKAIQEEDDSLFASGDVPVAKQNIIAGIKECLFNRDAQIGDNYAPRLFLNNDPSKQYQKCLYGTNTPCNGYKLKNAYERYFDLIQRNKEEVNPAPEEVPDYYIRLRNAIMRGLIVDDICCDSFGSAFQIFESINAKGQPLSSVDLIKCFLMQKASSNISDGRTRWNTLLSTVGAEPDNTSSLDKFMTAFLFTQMEERVSKASAYDKFKKTYEQYDYASIFDELQQAANHYKSMTTDTGWASDEPLRAFKILKITSIYVPLLAFARYQPDGVKGEEYLKLKKKLLSFAVRYQICGGTSNALDVPFKKMISIAKNQGSAEEAYKALHEHIRNDSNVFRASFASLTFSDSEESLARYLLEQIELFLEHKAGSDKQIPEEATLEHIIPKEWKDYVKEWGDDYILPENFDKEVVRSIGNMALLGSKDNVAAGNKPYSEKCKVYEEGYKASETSPNASYNLLGQLKNEYETHFTIEDVKSRAEKLADYAVVLWD